MKMDVLTRLLRVAISQRSLLSSARNWISVDVSGSKCLSRQQRHFRFKTDRDKIDVNLPYGRTTWRMWYGAATLTGVGLLLLAWQRQSNARRLIRMNEGHGMRPRVSINFPRVHAALPFGDAGDNYPSKDGQNLRASSRFNFIADVVENAAPAVVNIEIKGRDPFTGAEVTVSNGSGFIVDEDGLILTNAHVVAHRAHVHVKLHDGRSFEGRVGDLDYASDLATIQINCKGLPTLKLGTSAGLRPGEFVVAMGSPLALSNTITAGVVSSVHREGSELGLGHKNMDYIQTDAAITFGNSGGPLVNLDGEVIGINSMKVTAGISFAIPADYAKEFLDTARKQKSRGWFGSGSAAGEAEKKRRRYIGVTMLTLTPSIVLELQQRQSDFPSGVTRGVFIWRIVVGSPAHNGGLQPGDVVTAINGQDVKSANDLYRAVENSTELRLVVMRRNKKLALTVVPQD